MSKLQIDIVARNKATPALNKLNKDLDKTKSSLFNLKNVLLAVAGSVVVRQFFTLSNEFQNLQNRLKLVTNSTKELVSVQNELFEISRRTRGGFSETVELYQKLALQAANLKLQNEELLQITENVNKVIGIAGVDAIQASAGILQLSQAFASGRLQGDEFRSISENIPPLLDIFAKELKVTRGELKKLGSEGKITSEVIARSLLKETDNIGKKFEQITPTVGQATVRLRNSFVNLVGTFNEVTGTADAVSRGLLGISDAIDQLSKKSAQPKILQGLTLALTGILLDVDELEKKLGVFAVPFDEQDALRDQQKVIKEIAKDVAQVSERNFEIFEYTKGIHDNYKPHKTTVEKVLEKLKEHNRQYELSDEIFGSLVSASRQFSRAIAESLILGKSINMSFKELAQNILVDAVARMLERLTLLALEELIIKKIFKQDTDKLAVEKAITKEKRKQILLQAVLMAMGGGSPGGGNTINIGGSHAQGGAVSKGQPILVGENGPEIFRPNATGQIEQTARGMGGQAVNVTFNINTLDASGFEDLLVRSRGTITQLINSAVNERGKESLI